jgi:hypothetical protein
VNVAFAVYTPRVRRVAIAFGAVIAVGCGARAETVRPDDAIGALAAALRAGDVPALAATSGRPEADVAAAESRNAAELHALGETLARASVERSARVTLADGGALLLVRDGESWRVDRGVLGRPALSRPVDAVIAFHDALARARVDGMMTVLARVPRAELEAELTRWIDGTADADAIEISVQGESAIAITPTGERLELVREAGEWRVLSF